MAFIASDLVSVVIPVFNCKDYLARCIESALSQTHKPLEIVAVDDGSTDGSADVLASYASRIAVVSQANSGPSAARNNGVTHTSGSYLAFLDSDDLWDPRKTEVQFAALKEHPRAVAVYCDHRSVDAEDHVMGYTGALEHSRSSGSILEDLIRGQRIKSPTLVMVKREAFDAVGGFDTTLRYSEDYDLWLRLAVKGPILYQVETLASYRVHGGNVSLAPGQELKAYEGNMYALEKLVFENSGVDLRIKELAREKLYSTALSLGWARRRAGSARGAAQAYRCALALEPASLRAWTGFLSSFFSSMGYSAREK